MEKISLDKVAAMADEIRSLTSPEAAMGAGAGGALGAGAGALFGGRRRALAALLLGGLGAGLGAGGGALAGMGGPGKPDSARTKNPGMAGRFAQRGMAELSDISNAASQAVRPGPMGSVLPGRQRDFLLMPRLMQRGAQMQEDALERAYMSGMVD